MGICIYYQAAADDTSAADSTIRSAIAFAERSGWRWDRVPPQKPADQQDSEVAAGVVIYPHDSCEPIRLVFDQHFAIDDYVKTQFAGPAVHSQVVEFFKSLVPHLKHLDVVDEGDLWEVGDLPHTEGLFESFRTTLADYLATYPGAKGPVRLPSGRIADVVAGD